MPDDQMIREAADWILQGRLVAIPTETVYGLGANALNPLAVSRIFQAKRRPAFDPLIVHVSDIAMLQSLVEEFPEQARRIAAAAWPGPLTLVLPRKPCIPDLVTAGLPGVGVRIPAHPVTLSLIRTAGVPIAAPSANVFGGISPTTARHVADGLGDQVSMILDGGPCALGVESTVLSFMDSTPVVLRPGGFPIEQIEHLIGPVRRALPDPSRDDAAQPAPGMLSRHYAPGTPLYLFSRGETATPLPNHRCGLLTYGLQPFSGNFQRIEQLSPDENLQTCAAKFFAALRTLDSCGLDAIIAHKYPDLGLGIALNDRLTRASSATGLSPETF